MTATLPAGSLRWKDIAELTSASGFPCVSLLLATTPAQRMGPADVLALTGLIDRAERALGATGIMNADLLLARLRRLAREATGQATGRGLGLFVNGTLQRSVVLPVTVAPQVLIEPSFATRDLLRAVHRTPPHLLLTLYPGISALFQAQADHLSPVAMLPLIVHAAAQHDDDWSATAAATEAHFDEVDSVLAQQRREFPSPLVIAGTSSLVEMFCRRSLNLGRLAGRIIGAETTEEMQQRAARALEDYLRSRGLEALNLIEHTARTTPHLLAAGLHDCWAAVHQTPPVVLAVEQGYAAPGHHFAALLGEEGGDPAWLHDLSDDPYFVHDLIDDLIEAVINRAGWVAFVEDGALTQHGRVALVSMG